MVIYHGKKTKHHLKQIQDNPTHQDFDHFNPFFFAKKNSPKPQKSHLSAWPCKESSRETEPAERRGLLKLGTEQIVTGFFAKGATGVSMVLSKWIISPPL